ncbi:MAG: helix-turn-helix domain-containing protein [Halanaeroarchaeum sp.]
MAATTPTTDDASGSLTNVSSPSARLLYHALEERGPATVTTLSEQLGSDEDRVDTLLNALADEGLVEEVDGEYVA